MKILVLNCGSSSIKYQLFDMEKGEQVLAKGLVERIGIANSVLKHTACGKEAVVETADIPDHTDGIQRIVNILLDPVKGVLKDKNEIKAAGHRVAHGGEFFPESVFITSEVKEKIKQLFEVAPLHNPANLKGIDAMETLLPGLPQVAVFDTSFHQTMPEKAFLYGLPYEYYEKNKIRRYGFHGTSHKFVAQKAAALIGKNLEDLKIITCHLGNGSSIAAIKNGKSIDTSMGYTPVEGVIMGTRVGDVDSGALLSIMEREKMSVADANNLINKKSGLFGISGVSSDMRDIGAAAKEGNKQAKAALDVFAYKVKKFIGSYMAALNGLDVLVFTGGIGENDIDSRLNICKDLENLGIEVCAEKNNCRGKDKIISTDNSKVKVVTISTNEELVIARDTFSICSKINS